MGEGWGYPNRARFPASKMAQYCSVSRGVQRRFFLCVFNLLDSPFQARLLFFLVILTARGNTMQLQRTHSCDSGRYFVSHLRIASRRKINSGFGFETVECPMASIPDCARMLGAGTPYCLTYILVQDQQFVLECLSDRLPVKQRRCLLVEIVVLRKVLLRQHN